MNSPSPESPRLRSWWQPGVFDYSQVEAFIMRAAFATLFFSNIQWDVRAYTTQRNPTGLAHFFDFTWLARYPLGPGWKGLTIVGLALYALGWLPALGLLPACVIAIMMGTLIDSTAMEHTWQLVTLIALSQFLVYAWPRALRPHRVLVGIAFILLACLAAREMLLLPHFPRFKAGLSACLGIAFRYAALGMVVEFLGREILSAKNLPLADASPVKPGLMTHRLAIYASTVTFAAAYVICGISKLVNSHFQWVQKVPYLSVQLLKSNWAGYYDRLLPAPEWLTKVTQGIVDYPNLARLVFGVGLIIELAGFVVLINRRFALAGGLAIIALHLSISKIMNLNFQEHIAAALIFAVNLPGLRRTCEPWLQGAQQSDQVLREET